VHVLRNLPPEIAGALSSRASRASDSLLRVLLKEYFFPILRGENRELAHELEETVRFLNVRGFKHILNNQRAAQFYAKWLSQYGDDSIAQMTGTHLIFDYISQVAMKFIEDQRIGLEPIERSTRYVNFGGKVNGSYLYYTPRPELERLGLLGEYRATLDHLFDTYVALLPKFIAYLEAHYEEKRSVLEKKAFDTLRGLLPMATLGQVAFRGNAQAFEYLINRASAHPLGELRWIAAAAKEELDKEIPSLLLRVEEGKTKEYQRYLAGRGPKVREWLAARDEETIEPTSRPHVRLVEHDPYAEDKVLAAILYSETHEEWNTLYHRVQRMSYEERRELLARYAGGRLARWYKVGRAFESAYLRFEIVMNIGAYRDLHRHRMMTQERQHFSTHHGYDVPEELVAANLDGEFRGALDRAHTLFCEIAAHDEELAQYAVPLAYRIRFYQWQNFREFFWEAELRTISQGHPDYRAVEQEKYRIVQAAFPLLAELAQVDMHEYPIARRGTEERIAAKEEEILGRLYRKRPSS
jgi:thymidylate synthase ThyX